MKTQELSRYLLGKTKSLDLIYPIPRFNVNDSKELREKIITLNVLDARKIGINRNTLWYLQRRAKSHNQFQIYNKVKDKINI